MTSISGVEKEIERKYLLSNLPNKELFENSYGILHGWIPGVVIQERISASTKNKYMRVIKTGKGLTRIEAQELISEDLFKKLFAITDKQLRKHRYTKQDGYLLWEIDAFEDNLAGLFIAEVELPSEETEVIIPDWLAPYIIREVTLEPEYLNINLATKVEKID